MTFAHEPSSLTDGHVRALLHVMFGDACSDGDWEAACDARIVASSWQGGIAPDARHIAGRGLGAITEAQRIADGDGGGVLVSDCCEASIQGGHWCCACDHACKPKATTPLGRLALALRESRRTPK